MMLSMINDNINKRKCSIGDSRSFYIFEEKHEFLLEDLRKVKLKLYDEWKYLPENLSETAGKEKDLSFASIAHADALGQMKNGEEKCNTSAPKKNDRLQRKKSDTQRRKKTRAKCNGSFQEKK